MVSKTRMTDWVRGFEWKEVERGLDETPELIGYRDDKGRNWLHLCCGVNVAKTKQGAADAIKTADVLLKAGLDINQEAFTEGTFKATPLWYSISRGENLELAKFLLNRGSNPNHCLWAAAFASNLDAIRLLARAGAEIDQAGNETPFLFGVQWSHFDAAEELLKLGADVNYQDAKKMTALHYMLKKGSEKKHIAMLVRYGARGDIKNKEGATAFEIMMKKRDPEVRKLAAQLKTGS